MSDSGYIRIPFSDVVKATFDVLVALGGSGSNQQINENVISLCQDAHPNKTIDRPRPNGQGELEYRIAWARSYLKEYGILENIARGSWAIVPGKIDQIDADEIVNDVYTKWRKGKASSSDEVKPGENDAEPENYAEDGWKTDLLGVLTDLKSDAFERLTKRLLLACNFTDVEVTGRGADDGIDGTATAKINDLLGFSVVFQCKRYRPGNSVGNKEIQAFRGSLMTRADRGLFVTTSRFTKTARTEAVRSGAVPIDLMDGEMLMDKLKELELGVTTKMVERVTIDDNWFKNI
ncbi:MAG: restriction endonuclease [Gammaproteobacteria bacterium]|nr:restriction endonuclease [Gammaproteobacteria bacterium]